MAWRVLIYAFKIWISTVLVGTLIFVTLTYVFSKTPPQRGDFRYVWLFIVYGSGYSIPSLLVAWVGAFFINRTSRSRRVKRIWIALLAAPLTLVPFIISGWDELDLEWRGVFLIAGLYYVVTLAAIFLFRLPERNVSLS